MDNPDNNFEKRMYLNGTLMFIYKFLHVNLTTQDLFEVDWYRFELLYTKSSHLLLRSIKEYPDDQQT